MISLIISLYILFFLVSGEENQDNSILTTFKNDILKNMTKITFYGTLPSTTHYINLPIELSQVRQANSFSSFPTSKQTFYSRADICKQPQQVGSGPYRIPRWFYNSEASKCVPFYWSGCCANSNNFANQEHCQNTCEGMLQINDPGNDWFLVQHRVPEGKMSASNADKKTLTTADPCALGSSQFLLCQPTTPSTCSNQQFCHVGDSPITTVCCNKQTEVNVCQQPLNSGTGSSTLQRWFFYAPAGQCQTFTYRGLQGNENNFLSRIDCEQISNPCSFGSPLRDSQGNIGYCSFEQSSICPTSYYCHIGGDALTSLCCPEIGKNFKNYF